MSDETSLRRFEWGCVGPIWNLCRDWGFECADSPSMVVIGDVCETAVTGDILECGVRSLSARMNAQEKSNQDDAEPSEIECPFESKRCPTVEQKQDCFPHMPADLGKPASMRIVGGLGANHPTGFLFQAFGRLPTFWRITFGEEPVPAVPDDHAISRPRARSAGAESEEDGRFHLPSVTLSEHAERAALRSKQFGPRTTTIPASREERAVLDEKYSSSQWPECPVTFMSSRTPRFYMDRLTLGQVRVAEKESDLQQLSSSAWFRCGRMASEVSMLNLDPAKELPSFGGSIADVLEENIAANQMNTAREPLFSADEIALVRHGIRAATECVTMGSPFLRNDIFRIDPRVLERCNTRQSESHISGWLVLSGYEDIVRKGKTQPMDFLQALLLLTSFDRIFSSERSREIAKPLLGFNFSSSDTSRTILTAVDCFRIMRQVQILPKAFQEILVARAFLQGRFQGMISCSSSAQYARCSLTNELFVTRALFPEIPTAMEDHSPLNLQVLLAAEQSKSNNVALRLKAKVRTAEVAAMTNATEPEIPQTAQDDWEEDYYLHLSDLMTTIGLNASSKRFLLLRYGDYLIEHRVQYGTRPDAADIQRLVRLLPQDMSDPSQCEPSAQNWLAKFSPSLPASLTEQDLSSLQRIQHYSVTGTSELALGEADSSTSVFEPASEEPSSENPHNLGMMEGELPSSTSSVEGVADYPAPGPSGCSSGDPSEFVRSYLSPHDLQALADRILQNPLLTPAQFEDRFTHPLDCRDESQSCLVTLPAYVTVRVAGPPSSEPRAMAESGFEAAFLSGASHGPRPCFRLMSYPRPTIVSHHEVVGETVDRHGRKQELRQPVYTTKNRSFSDYLQEAQAKKKNKKKATSIGARMKFPRGTFLKIMSDHCHPSEDYGPELTMAERLRFASPQELHETSLYHGLRPAFGSGPQYPKITGREFSPRYDHAGRVSLLLNLQPMLEPTLVDSGVVRPRLSVCAHLDLHSLTPIESLAVFGACLQQGYEVLKGYTRDGVRFFRSEWPTLPCYQIVVSPGLIAKTTEKNDPGHKSRGYRLWQTKKGGQLIASLVGGCGVRRPLSEGTPEMEQQHDEYHRILQSRTMSYVWQNPEGTPDNYRVRDPSKPQASVCNLWHKERRTYFIDKQPVTEEYWEMLIFEGFSGVEVHEENYRLDQMETGSRQYFSWKSDFERETMEALLALIWLLEGFLPTVRARNIGCCEDKYFGVSRFNPAGMPVHCLHYMGSLQASHGPLSDVMLSLEKVYSMVHNRDEALYPRTSSLKMSPELEIYFNKVARFRNVDALYTEESYYHVTRHGTVVEAKEEMGLQDGFRVVDGTPSTTESREDFAWYYGSLNSDQPSGQQRLFGGLEFAGTGFY